MPAPTLPPTTTYHQPPQLDFGPLRAQVAPFLGVSFFVSPTTHYPRYPARQQSNLMDAFDEAMYVAVNAPSPYSESSPSDPESSQASLVLQDLITEDDSDWTANEANGQDRKYQRVPDDHLKYLSPSRNLGSHPRYHYHGLADTQTQTQQCDEDGQLQQENLRKKSIKGAAASTATLLSGFVRDGSNSVSHKSNLPSHNKARPMYLSRLSLLITICIVVQARQRKAGFDLRFAIVFSWKDINRDTQACEGLIDHSFQNPRLLSRFLCL